MPQDYWTPSPSLYAGIVELFINIPKTGMEYDGDAAPGSVNAVPGSVNATSGWKSFKSDLMEGLHFVVDHPGMLATASWL